MVNKTKYLVRRLNNQHPILDLLYVSFRASYSQQLKYKWHYRSVEQQIAFCDVVIENLKANWAIDLSNIDPCYDVNGNLIVFNNFDIEVGYFDLPGDGDEVENRFWLTCWFD